MTSAEVRAAQQEPRSTPYTFSSGLTARAHPAIAWLRGALVLAIAAQMITVSALNSADPLTVSWSSLLLGIAPAPLAALAVLAPTGYRKPAIVLALVVLVVAIIGGIKHTGLFFVPELAVLLVATFKAWTE
jgi:hypothetical protein